MAEIYALKLPSDISPERYRSLLGRIGPSQRERVERFRQKEDAYRTLLGEVLARVKLGKRIGVPPGCINILKSKYGKPCLADTKGIHFNISHSGEWVVLIIDCESVGIDIEKVVPISPELADRVFSAQESMDLRQKPEHERVNLFFELWTLKESYIKAVGVGLTLSLKSFTIRKLPGGEITLDPPAERYHFKQYDLNTHYKLSVCSSSPQLPGSVEILGLDDLL